MTCYTEQQVSSVMRRLWEWIVDHTKGKVYLSFIFVLFAFDNVLPILKFTRTVI